MTQDEQIDFLNSSVKAKLAPSKIHGIGVFALQDIRKNEKANCVPLKDFHWFTIPYGSMSKLFPEIRELCLTRWPSIVNGSHFLSPNDIVWLITFMNHSAEPNYDIDTDSALRDIKKGEEITENYMLMTNYDKVYPWLKEALTPKFQN